MTQMTITLNLWTLAFIVSFCANIFIFFYIRHILRELVSTSEKIIELNNEVIGFSAHLKSVYELEAFYGEPVLESLLAHAVYLADKFEEFDNSISFEDAEETETEEENIDNDESGEETNETFTRQQELFYGGTRSSNS